ncbi:MAG TPA: DUF4845 domain-containing protein [Usitatibacter sp.]|nr:DUF4845 domain-containing protein [Usitatibacter sp.]
MRKQRGITITGTIITLAVLGFIAVMAAKLMPAYVEYYGVKKILKSMESSGGTKGTVKEIRYAYEKFNAIEDVKSVRGEDLEITKSGGEAVVSANWSVRVPLVGNVSACLDFSAATGSGE